MTDQKGLKKPKVMLVFDSFGTGGPVSAVNRMSKAFQDRGCEVTILGIGDSFEHAIKFDGNPERVRIPYGNAQQRLCEAFDRVQPDVMITEHYPFVPDVVDAMDHFVQHAKAAKPTLQLYSVPRDIPIVPKNPSDLVRSSKLFDAIFVRGDEKLLPFSHFLPALDGHELQGKIHHVGYMIPKPVESARKGSGQVIISLGGVHGALDQQALLGFIETLGSKDIQPSLRTKHWRIILGKHCSFEDKEALKHARDAALPETLRHLVDIEDPQPDLHHMIGKADMVVTRGGITAVEALSQGKLTTIITRGDQDSNEQVVRANALKKECSDWVRVVNQPAFGSSSVEAKGLWGNRQSGDLLKALNDLASASRINYNKPNILVNGHETVAEAVIHRFTSIQQTGKDPGVDINLEGRIR